MRAFNFNLENPADQQRPQPIDKEYSPALQMQASKIFSNIFIAGLL
jgi:hypothetical protein